MDYRDTIISRVADMECRRVSRKVIRALQKMTEGRQSGDDTPLKNIWDEVCVQVQQQESVMWDLYVDTITAIIALEIEKLAVPIKQAIWLQTDRGMDWELQNEDQREASYCEEDITEHILDSFVLSAAANWTNKRIERYLEHWAE